jgi:hypothetical protein
MPQLRRRSGGGHERPATTARHRRSRVCHRGALGQRRTFGDRIDRLVDRHRLAREGRLVHRHPSSRDQSPVRRNALALAQNDQVPGDQLFHRQDSLAAGADDARVALEHSAQSQHRPLGPHLLGKSEQRVQDHDRSDRRRLDSLPDQERDRRGGDQQADERICELANRDRRVRRSPRPLEPVGPEPGKPRLGLLLPQAAPGIAAEFPGNVLDRGRVWRLHLHPCGLLMERGPA